MPLLWLNLVLYTSLLALALLLRPAPLSLSPRRRQRAHLLITLFSASRSAWAAYLLHKQLERVRTGDIPAPPCLLAMNISTCDHIEFVWDSASTLTFVAAALLVGAQVATVLLAGFRSSQRLWAFVRFALLAELGYLLVLVAAAADPHALPAFASLVDSTSAVLGSLYLLVAVGLLALGILYRAAAPASLLRSFRVARIAIPSVFLAVLFFCGLRAADLLVNYERRRARISATNFFWILLLYCWLPELVPSVGILALLRSLSRGRALRPRLTTPSIFRCPFSSGGFADVAEAPGAPMLPMEACGCGCGATGPCAAQLRRGVPHEHAAMPRPGEGVGPVLTPAHLAAGAIRRFERVDVWYSGVRSTVSPSQRTHSACAAGNDEHRNDAAGDGARDVVACSAGASADGGGVKRCDDGAAAAGELQGGGATGSKLVLRERLAESEYCFTVAAAAAALLHAEAVAERECLAREYFAAAPLRTSSSGGVGPGGDVGVLAVYKDSSPQATPDVVPSVEHALYAVPPATPMPTGSAPPDFANSAAPGCSAPTTPPCAPGGADADGAAWSLDGSLAGVVRSTEASGAPSPNLNGRWTATPSGAGTDEQTDLLDRIKTDLRRERKLPEAAWRRWRMRRMDSRLKTSAEVLAMMRVASACGVWPSERWGTREMAVADAEKRVAAEYGLEGTCARCESGTASSSTRATPASRPRKCCSCGVLSFKPSTLKDESDLRHLPTNLHVQSLTVYAAAEIATAAATIEATSASALPPAVPRIAARVTSDRASPAGATVAPLIAPAAVARSPTSSSRTRLTGRASTGASFTSALREGSLSGALGSLSSLGSLGATSLASFGSARSGNHSNGRAANFSTSSGGVLASILPDEERCQYHYIKMEGGLVVATCSGREAAMRTAPLRAAVALERPLPPRLCHAESFQRSTPHRAGVSAPRTPGHTSFPAGIVSTVGNSEMAFGEAAEAIDGPPRVHPLGHYLAVTVGAPAAHALGFASGGAWQLEAKLNKTRREAENTEDRAYACYLRRKTAQLADEISARRELCVSQALPAIVTIFAARLEQQLRAAVDTHSGCPAGDVNCDRRNAATDLAQQPSCSHSSCCSAAAVIETWRRCGFLIGWQSLLSTYGDEASMLGDTADAIATIGRRGLLFRLVRARRNRMTPADGIDTTEAAVSCGTQSADTLGGTGRGPTTSKVVGERFLASEAERRAVGGVSTEWKMEDPPAVSFVSLRRGLGSEFVIEMAVAPDLWEGLPHSLRSPDGAADPATPCGDRSVQPQGSSDGYDRSRCCTKRGACARLIRCVVVLISQGIDAKQSVAHAVGGAEVQAAINKNALATLRWYADVYCREGRLSLIHI